MKKERYDVFGMSCAACSSKISKVIGSLEGVSDVQVNLLTNSMNIEYDEDRLDIDKIIKTVRNIGYDASIHGNGSINNKADKKVLEKGSGDELSDMRKRLIYSFIFLIPLMYLSMGHMLKLYHPPIIMGVENGISFAFTQMLLTLPIMYVNRKYYINGFKAIYMRSPNMDSLIAVGSMAAFIYGIIAVYAIGYGLGHGNKALVEHYIMNLYFESTAMILSLITLGKYFEAKSKKKTTDAISKLLDLTPKTSNVIRDGQEIIINTEDVVKDDILIVRPGQTISVDGILIEGMSSVDESAITGESIPVEKNIGDKLIGATINKSGTIKMKATHVGEDTAISKIIELVEEAASSKAPIAKLADKVSGVFVPVVMLISLITFIVWLLIGAKLSFALSLAIAVLIISCPCALGLATPVAIMVGTGKAAENGILIKSAECLETTHILDTVVFDKTGTVTYGKPVVTDIVTNGIEENELLRVAAAIENLSEHPLAEAIVNKAKDNNIAILEAFDMRVHSGRGIEAVFEGKKILAGNKALIFDKFSKDDESINTWVKKGDDFAGLGKTPMYFADEDDILGIIAVADTIKEDSQKAVELLKENNIDVILLTGDHEKTARAIATEVGIDNVLAEVLPDEKENKIRELILQGKKVAMVGDGINDAPALARADVGIAIGAGTDIAIEAADIVLMNDSILDVFTAIKLSKAVIRNIKQNLFWAFFYNIICIPVAAGLLYKSMGLRLNPMFGAFAMSFSSIFVVGNALRLRGLKLKHKSYKKGENINIGTENKEIISNKEEIDMEEIIKVDGMMCAHCKANVEKICMESENVLAAEVDLEKKEVALKHNNADIEAIKNKINLAGYEVK